MFVEIVGLKQLLHVKHKTDASEVELVERSGEARGKSSWHMRVGGNRA